MSAHEPGFNEIASRILRDVWDNAGNLLRVGLAAGTQLIGKVAIDQTTPGTTNGVVVNSGSIAVTSLPATVPASLATSRAVINIAASGDNTIVAGVALQTVRVHKIVFTCAQPVSIIFKSGAGTNLTGAMPFGANGGLVLDEDADPWFATAVGEGFVMNLSSAVQVSGRVYYTQSVP